MAGVAGVAGVAEGGRGVLSGTRRFSGGPGGMSGVLGGVFGWSKSGRPGLGRPVGGNTVPVLLVGTRVAVPPKRSWLLAPTPVVPRVPGEVPPVAVPPMVAAPVAGLAELAPPAALALPKKVREACSQLLLLMSGHWLRVKLGACARRAWSALTVKTMFAPGCVPAARVSPLTRISVHGIGTRRPLAEVRTAASAQPTGLRMMFSMRPSGVPAASMTREPSTLTITGVVASAVVVMRAAPVNVEGPGSRVEG